MLNCAPDEWEAHAEVGRALAGEQLGGGGGRDEGDGGRSKEEDD